jgi:hypothetical protein
MAKVVDSMPDAERGRRVIYPWDEWLNGNVWELEHGKDFQSTPLSFRQIAYNRAGQRGHRAAVQIHGSKLYLQAVDK